MGDRVPCYGALEIVGLLLLLLLLTNAGYVNIEHHEGDSLGQLTSHSLT